MDTTILNPQVGAIIEPDNWGLASRLIASDWERATYRIPSCRYEGVAYGVNVEVTGRRVQRRQGSYWVRVKLTFVGDGEADTISRGWMKVDPWNGSVVVDGGCR